jgi:membrane-associated phospholipid phosphatase
MRSALGSRAGAAGVWTTLLLFPVAVPAPAAAAEPTPLDALGGDAVHAFASWPNVALYAVAVGGTGAMAYGGGDQAVRVFFQQHLKSTAWGDATNLAGYALPTIVCAAVWGSGVAGDRDHLGAGSAAIQAVGLTVATTFLLKWVTGRPYPLNGGDPNAPDVLDHPDYAHTFTPFNAKGAWAWPSGHTSAITSVVAALSAWDPDDVRIPLVGYPVVAAIGLGLMAGDRHWTSDVFSGALLGYAIGSSVGRDFRQRARRANDEKVAAASWSVVPLASPGAVGGAIAGAW